jgi:hypothetical protein
MGVGLKRNYLQSWVKLVGQDSAVGIQTRYGLDGPGIESRGDKISAPVQTGPEARRASYTMGTGVQRAGLGVGHPSPSRAEVNERVDLFLCSPSGPSWPVLRWTFPLSWVKLTTEKLMVTTNNNLNWRQHLAANWIRLVIPKQFDLKFKPFSGKKKTFLRCRCLAWPSINWLYVKGISTAFQAWRVKHSVRCSRSSFHLSEFHENIWKQGWPDLAELTKQWRRSPIAVTFKEKYRKQDWSTL